jgi:hypothetical protein
LNKTGHGGPQGPFGPFVVENILLFLIGIETRFVGLPVRDLMTIQNTVTLFTCRKTACLDRNNVRMT